MTSAQVGSTKPTRRQQTDNRRTHSNHEYLHANSHSIIMHHFIPDEFADICLFEGIFVKVKAKLPIGVPEGFDVVPERTGERRDETNEGTSEYERRKEEETFMERTSSPWSGHATSSAKGASTPRRPRFAPWDRSATFFRPSRQHRC